eukprot:2870869-Pleurochrysis_carterae.AAC.2
MDRRLVEEAFYLPANPAHYSDANGLPSVSPAQETNGKKARDTCIQPNARFSACRRLQVKQARYVLYSHFNAQKSTHKEVVPVTTRHTQRPSNLLMCLVRPRLPERAVFYDHRVSENLTASSARAMVSCLLRQNKCFKRSIYVPKKVN